MQTFKVFLDLNDEIYHSFAFDDKFIDQLIDESSSDLLFANYSDQVFQCSDLENDENDISESGFLNAICAKLSNGQRDSNNVISFDCTYIDTRTGNHLKDCETPFLWVNGIYNHSVSDSVTSKDFTFGSIWMTDKK